MNIFDLTVHSHQINLYRTAENSFLESNLKKNPFQVRQLFKIDVLEFSGTQRQFIPLFSCRRKSLGNRKHSCNRANICWRYGHKRIHPLTNDTARVSSLRTVFVHSLFCNQTAIGSWLQKKGGRKYPTRGTKMAHLCLWLCLVRLLNERERQPAARRVRPYSIHA